MSPTPPPRRAFWEALGLNAVWMNVSEVWRYFAVVKPRVARDFAEVPGIVPSTPAIAALWTMWDALLIVLATGLIWIMLERWRPRAASAVAAGTVVWAATFVLLWLGLHNMGLARPATVAVALPLAWIELVVAAHLVAWRMRAASAPQAVLAPA